MVGSFVRLAAAAAFSAVLAGCSTAPDSDFSYAPAPRETGATMTRLAKPVSCVPFARDLSGINIHGDAYTWWDQADGHYPRSSTPREGAVMVLAGYGGSKRAHVAVVRRRVSAREIRVDHANWLNNGAIFLDDPVADISPDNDWSQVRVWNVETNGWGTHIYDVQGFIGPADGQPTMRMAQTSPSED